MDRRPARAERDAEEPAGQRYRVVADALRAILHRNGGTGAERLPTEAELALRFGVSRGTVRRAYLDLVSEGLVERVPGRGSFPLRRPPYRRAFNSVDELLALSEDTLMEVIQPLAAVTDPDAASALGLQFDTVLRVTYRRSHEAAFFCHTEVSVPPRFQGVLETAGFLRQPQSISRDTVLGILDRESTISGTRQVITAVSAPADLAALIGCAEMQPVLRVERVHFDAEGRPAERCVNHFNPERYVYRLQLQREHSHA
jgi:DNA-binding GntR family transcriptional regulator